MAEREFDTEAFQREALEQREARRAELASALVDLETAAWLRDWTKLQKARGKIMGLTGITITGPLRRELEQARKDYRPPVRI